MQRDVNPKKFLGQHFLIDDNISKKIVEAINFKKFKKVIEIGPGKGALTKHLLHIKDMLTLIEVDKESVEFLNSEFQKEKLNIVEADFLKFDIGINLPIRKRHINYWKLSI
jgi:16S rRNA (adenine1518-N6/adenine1519-N6)-dimethyltransferase